MRWMAREADRLILGAAAVGGLIVLGCSIAVCIRICLMEKMLCSSALFRSKLHGQALKKVF